MKSLPSIVIIVGLLSLLQMSACRQMEVVDDLYDIRLEQGFVDLQVAYARHSDDMRNSLPASYSYHLSSATELPMQMVLSDRHGHPVFDSVSHSIDTLVFRGYAQPGQYELYSYSASRGYLFDSTFIEVMPSGLFVERRPSPLFYGAWMRQIRGGDYLRDRVEVRQRTRQLVFRILMGLGDSIRYNSSEVILTNVPYRLDRSTGDIDPTYVTPIPLQMHLEMFRGEDGVLYPSLVDTLNVLTPTAKQYAEWQMDHTLSVRINFTYYLNGQPHRIAPVECSFPSVLAPAYSADYVQRQADPYCLERFVWQAADTLTFHSSLDTVTGGNIVPWEIVTDFGKL